MEVSSRSTFVGTSQSHSLPPARYSPGRTPIRRHAYKLQASAGIERTPEASVREWRQYYRYLGYQKADHLPRVSWSRYHLSVLFVDRTDTVRARVAAGLFDRIANWNGYARALYPSACGVDTSGSPADITTSVGLMSQAGLLKIPPKLFSRPGQQFEVEDLDRNDIILAADSRTKGRLQDMLCEGVSDCSETMNRVALLTDFLTYIPSNVLMRTGGSAILEPELKQIVEPALSEAQSAREISSPNLTGGSAEWNRMVQVTIASCAGLCQYCIDAWPPDLIDYDPV